ncbi:MAG: nucleotidyltransferase family protein [Candidatus Hodarchaeales archaeon]
MISCIVLAAGESTRFPGNKLLYEIKPNISLLEFLLHSLIDSKVNQIIVVLGYEADIVRETVSILSDNKVRTIVNHNYQEGGMSSSIRQGMKLISDDKAILITPGDIPLIPTAVFDLIIEHFDINCSDIIIPTYNNSKGHPILISSKYFSQVKKITEENRGLKGIIETHWNEIEFLPTKNKGILRDVDSLEDAYRIFNSL